MPFYSDEIYNMTKMHAAKMVQQYGQARYALVKEYNPETNCVLVAYYNPETDDDDLLSGWLPLLIPYLGVGDDTEHDEGGEPWGIVCPPNIDQRVIVLSQFGDFNSGLVVGGSYSDISPVPTVDDAFTEDGEYLIKHKTGSYIKFFNNGDITVFAHATLNFHAGEDMNVKVGGNLTVEVDGTISVKAKAITEKADSTITLDTPLTFITGDLILGKAPSGAFSAGHELVTVTTGIITSLFP